MIAALLEDFEKLVVKEVPTPRPGPGEVLVRMKACGICLTDYAAFTGRRRNFTMPCIIGHEMAGVIAQVGPSTSLRTGPGVVGWAEGDEVAISPMVFCGRCRYCRLGQHHYCTQGIVLGGDGQDIVKDGGFAEYIAVPADALYAKPSHVPFEAAALTEPLAGSYKGMVEYSQARVGEDVVIIGAGSMGLLLTMIAARAGVGRLVLVDVADFRLNKAVELGATHVVNASRDDVRKRVYDICPDGPDLVFEAAGTFEAASLTLYLTRRGTRINMFGVIIPGTIPFSPQKAHFLETRMDASFSVNPRVMTRSMDLISRGVVDPSRIITHRFPLEQIEEAFATMASPERIKIMITMSDVRCRMSDV